MKYGSKEKQSKAPAEGQQGKIQEEACEEQSEEKEMILPAHKPLTFFEHFHTPF